MTSCVSLNIAHYSQISIGQSSMLLSCDIMLFTLAGKICINASVIMLHVLQIDAVNLASLDAIIISNFLSMLALPFITENTGFKGTIYATDPTIQTGR